MTNVPKAMSLNKSMELVNKHKLNIVHFWDGGSVKYNVGNVRETIQSILLLGKRASNCVMTKTVYYVLDLI